MAENIDINVNANTTTAQRNIDALKNRVDGLNSVFGKLKTALAGIAIGNMISSALQFADAMSDISDATGIAVQNIVGFSKAVAQAGGDGEKAQQGLLKFVQTIGEAANGSKTTQSAFEAVGVSLQDLRTLSEQDLLAKTIQGLGQITDKSEQARLKMELFGKSMRSVSAEGLAAGYDTAVAKAEKYADAIKAAGQTQQNLETAMSDFKIALLAALQPITELAAKLNSSIDVITNVIKVLLTLGITIASFTLWGRIVRGVAYLFTQLGLAAETVQAAFIALSLRFSSLGRFGAYLSDVLANVGLFFSNLITKSPVLAKSIEYIGTAIQPLIGLMAGAAAAAAMFYDKIKNFLGFKSDTSQEDAETKKLLRQQEAAQKTNTAVREVTDAYAKQAMQLRQTAKEFARQNQEIINQINLDAQLIGKSEDYAERVRAINDLHKRYADQIRDLTTARDQLTGEDKKLIPVYNEQIRLIQSRMKADEDALNTALDKLQTQRALEKEREASLERINQQLENQKRLDEELLKIRQSTQGALDAAKFEGAQMGRNPLEKQFASIQESAKNAALEASRAFAATFEGEELTAEQARQLADGLKLIADRYKEIADVQSANLEQSRTWAQGWKDAFNEYMDNATNAARKAGEVFGSITRNMENAIDNFVKTGKFSFKDFARSIIQDMLAIELKAAASKILGGIFGSGNILGSIFGFANGGTPPVNKPSLVGERGPELFVPKTNGTIIPNEALRAGAGAVNAPVTNNYVTYNVSAIDAKSVAQFFAENRKTMLGSVELARKELPYGNR